ncbi:uncharacterized protein [Chelonus insularis]|uniref:uncharacterized protein n=1 Tax=Chelonus insularis TaxID=460826 RepID=UPI001589AA1E|nr:uncharacterized protein LOC118069021 [Chelonus insularis]XP_034942723.1 uncharacterized protein LOC118069021 [Chelonus insularis]
MEEPNLRRYYRAPAYNWIIWKYMVLDNDLRAFFGISHDCGFVTMITIVFAVVILMYSLLSIKVSKSNERMCRALQNETTEKLPRKRSILSVRPAYNCIHKHLQQTDVFQEKAKRTVHKECLEVELMQSRIFCMKKLLEPAEGLSVF